MENEQQNKRNNSEQISGSEEKSLWAQQLRQQAVRQVKQDTQPLHAEARPDHKLIEELKIHQVELEMQNQQLIESEQQQKMLATRYHSLFDTSPVAIIEVDRSGTIHQINRAAKQLFEINHNNLYQSITPFLPDSLLLNRMLREIHASLDHSACRPSPCRFGYFQGEERVRSSGGQLHCVQINGHLIEGEEPRYLLTLTDISDRVEQERQREQIAYQAGMEEINASVFHNIGNTIHAQNGAGEMLSERLSSTTRLLQSLLQVVPQLQQMIASEDQAPVAGWPALLQRLPLGIEQFGNHMQQALEQAAESVEELQQGNRHVSEIIRIQQQMAHGMEGSTFQHRAFDPVEAIHDAISMDRIGHQRSGITITLSTPDPLQPLHCSRNGFLQLLINLLKNSREAIETQQMEDPQRSGEIVVTTTALEGGKLQLSVMDNGSGFDAETRNRLFQFGFTTKEAGNGFGLHSIANFVRQQGGGVTIDSDGPGKGCCFTLSMRYRSEVVL